MTSPWCTRLAECCLCCFRAVGSVKPVVARCLLAVHAINPLSIHKAASCECFVVCIDKVLV
jgi:hypothetical protein